VSVKGLPPDFEIANYDPPEPFDGWEILTWYGRLPDGQPSIVVFRHTATGKMVHHQHHMLDRIRLDPKDRHS